MKITLQFILTYVTFFLILGIVTAHYFPFHHTIILILIIVGFVTLFKIYNQTKATAKFNIHFGFSLMILSFIIGISTVLLNNKLLSKQHYTQFINSEIVSTKDKIPQLYHVKVRIDEVLKSGAFHHKYEVQINKINGKPYTGKILLNISIDSITIPLEVDQNIQFYGVFKDIEAPKNPYYFDYKKYLEQQQIHHQLFITQKEIQLLESKEYSLKGFAFQLRKKINEKLKPFSVPKDEMAVINALLLGQRQEISKELMENYTKAGAIHILAISGLHIGIILLILHFLFSPLENFKNGKIIKSVILILLLWMYALIAGLSASVVRAVMMFSVVAIGMNLNKKPSVINTLIVSLFILLLINPLYFFNVGFQLSYLAVFAIVIIQPMISKIWNPKNKIIKFFWNLLTVSFAAQFGVLPLSLYYFHQFPGLFIISNLVIIPFLGI
ncbi:MAG: ComEC family competence protein, partial [Flavobacteriaceae bacterium]|nr:ComEC family competence protein [Flavobacteriaceae bacterium]